MHMAKEKVKKEPLKTRCPRKYYRNAYWACQGGEWAAIATPIIAVFGAKWNEYFDFVENTHESVRLTIGCILALVVSAILMYKKAKHQEKVEKKATMLTYVLGVGMAFALAYFCKVIVNDLVLILGCEFAGAAVAYGLDVGLTQEMRRKQVLYRDARDELDAKEAAEKEQKVKENERRQKEEKADIV